MQNNDTRTKTGKQAPILSLDNLAAALHLAKLGFRVFPAKADRTPVAGFKWKQDSSKDPAIIRGWWQRYPDAIPALPTGPLNGVSVVDLDKKNGKDGVANWQGLGRSMEAGLTVETPSGGLHLYYSDDIGTARTTAGTIAIGVDTRGRGGYVIAPGAILPDGRYYRITTGDIESVAMGIAPAFPILRQAERPADQAEPQTNGPQADLAEIGQALFLIPNDAAYGPWVKTLMALHNATGGSPEGLDLARAWCSSYPSYSRKDVTDKWRSFGKLDRAAVTVASLFAEAREHGWQAITADSFDDDTDAADSTDIDDFLDGKAPVAKPKTASRLTFLTPGECANLPARDYLIKGLVAPGQVGCIFGDPGAGKSLIAPRLAYAVAQGSEAFGLRTRQGGVFYVACEDEEGMAGRMTALHTDLGEAPSIYLVRGCSDLFSPGQIQGKGSLDAEALRLEVKARKPKLIIIDTLAMAMPGLEENDAAGMNRVVQIGKALARHGAAVIFVHHGTKAEGNTPRGHSVFNGALDFSIHVKAADQSGIVRGQIRKNRNGPADLGIAFHIGTRHIGTDVDGEPVHAPICEPCDPLDMAGAGPRLSAAQAAAMALVRQMAGHAGQVFEAEWRTAAIEGRAISGVEDRANRRKAVSRALQSLTQMGLVRVADDTIYIADSESLAAKFDGGFDD